jgi:GT2 family glycosyltransferase
MPKVLVVTLNYRTPDMTVRAAEASIRAMQGLEAELVIVDNDSGDGSYEKIQRAIGAADWAKDAPIRVIQAGHNGGFGAGNNVGMRARMSDGSRPDYFYVQNSDAFPDDTAIAALVNHLESHPEAAIAGSCLRGEDGGAQLTTFRFPTVWSEFEGAIRLGLITRLLRTKSVPLFVNESQPVSWLAGASVLMRRTALDDVGAFDETFFLYFEETDLCLRAQNAGHQVHYVHESQVVHIGSVSTGMGSWPRVPQYWLDSRWRYFAKNHGKAYAAIATLMHVAGGLLWRIRRVLQGKSRADPPYFLRDLIVHDVKALLRPVAKTKMSLDPMNAQEVRAE